MINRRHIRAKVMQVLYSQRNNAFDNKLDNQLKESMEDMYRLYLLMLSIFIKLRHREINQQEKAKKTQLNFLYHSVK